MKIRTPAKFKTQRLVLRPLNLSDYKVWKEAYFARKPPIYQYDLTAPKGATFSREEFKSLVQRHRKLAKEDRVYVLGVFQRKTGAYLGHVDLAVLRRSDMQWGNLGYGILNQYYGQGFGTEAAKAGLEIGFRFLGFHRLEAVINMDNLRSNRLAKSIGMKQEGKRRAFIFENGKWQDHRVYAAIPEDVGLRSRSPG
jgi:ribosomal-protein-alanine N-acetyltransferase